MSQPVSHLISAPAAVRAAAVLLLAACGGCSIFHRQNSAPPMPPAVSIEQATFVGSPISGPTASAAGGWATGDVLRVDVRWHALGEFPRDTLSPLDAQARLTTAPLAAGAVLTSGNATRAIRFGTGEPAQSFLAGARGGAFGVMSDAATQVGYLAPGSTLRLWCALPMKGDRTRAITVSVGLPVSASTTTPSTQSLGGSIAIAVDGFAAPSPAGSSGPEVAFLDDLSIADGSDYTIVFPLDNAAGAGSAWKALVGEITIRRNADDAQAVALRRDLDDATTRVRAGVPVAPSGDQPELQSAVRALAHTPLRPPLLFIATRTGAEIAADFVLIADGAKLAELRDAVVAGLPPSPQTIAPADLSWLLDRSAVELLSAPAADGASSELESLCVVHAGEVGRHAESLREIVKVVHSAADLKLRLIGENYIALEDNAPGARVRAYDWLKSQGKAPAGYDPLADRKARRDAINNALTAAGGKP